MTEIVGLIPVKLASLLALSVPVPHRPANPLTVITELKCAVD
jgi:hypothetical protein